MDQEKKQAVALMRYSAIAPLITSLSDDYESLTAFFNAASVRGVIHPDGSLKHYSPHTIERLYIPTRQSTLHGVLVHDFRRYSARFPVISACGLFRYRYSGFC